MKLTSAALVTFALVLAQSRYSSGQDGVYTLSIVKTGDSYTLEGNKTVGQPYQPGFGGNISWAFTNTTGAPATIKFGSFVCTSGTPDTSKCPLHFIKSSSGACGADTLAIANGATVDVIAEIGTQACVYDNVTDPMVDKYDFVMTVTPEGSAERPIDPQLQIDRGGGLAASLGHWLVVLIAAVLPLIGIRALVAQ